MLSWLIDQQLDISIDEESGKRNPQVCCTNNLHGWVPGLAAWPAVGLVCQRVGETGQCSRNTAMIASQDSQNTLLCFVAAQKHPRSNYLGD